MQRFSTYRQAQALLMVKSGADVMSLGVASCLRQIEREHPEFVTITQAEGKYRGIDRLPYFGAIATPEGVRWAQEHRNDPDEAVGGKHGRKAQSGI